MAGGQTACVSNLLFDFEVGFVRAFLEFAFPRVDSRLNHLHSSAKICG
jgi:hypothetical protein